MSVELISSSFKQRVSEQIELHSEGHNRFRVFTPFQFDDRDHLVVVLRQEEGGWVLSDEGHTYMHLTYDIGEKDLQRGTRAKIIANTLDAFRIEDREGELRLRVEQEDFGGALYDFVQALLKITDVSYLSRDRIRSTFLEDLRHFLGETVPSERLSLEWHDPVHDPAAHYAVDYRINGTPVPLFILALLNDDHVRDATITLLQELCRALHLGEGLRPVDLPGNIGQAPAPDILLELSQLFEDLFEERGVIKEEFRHVSMIFRERFSALTALRWIQSGDGVHGPP